jgi:hypothetical protein
MLFPAAVMADSNDGRTFVRTSQRGFWCSRSVKVTGSAVGAAVGASVAGAAVAGAAVAGAAVAGAAVAGAAVAGAAVGEALDEQACMARTATARIATDLSFRTFLLLGRPSDVGVPTLRLSRGMTPGAVAVSNAAPRGPWWD